MHRPSRSPESANYKIGYSLQGTSSAEDTKKAVAAFLDAGIDLLLFCGGDGTARDVFEVVQQKVPILGIPAGVKMYSAVFALDPQTAAALVSGPFNLKDAEVMDVDEEAYRRGVLDTHLFGIARVPAHAYMTQTAKQVFEEEDEGRAKEEIARFMQEVLLPGVLLHYWCRNNDRIYHQKAGTHKNPARCRCNDRRSARGIGCGRKNAP